MNKKEFFTELNEYLIGVKREDKEEILQDYEEHFKVGKKNKRSESDIVKSLGDPKQIAREIRRELSYSDKEELKSEAIETWVAAKKLSIHLFDEAKHKIERIPKTTKGRRRIKHYSGFIVLALLFLLALLLFNGSLVLIAVLVAIGYVLFKHLKYSRSTLRSEQQQKNSIPKQDEKSNTLFRVVLVIAFNVLLFIWIWISLFSVMAALLVSGLAILASSILIIVFTIFALIRYTTSLTKDILFSGLFFGMGLGMLSWFFIALAVWLIKLFFRYTKLYIEWNSRFIQK